MRVENIGFPSTVHCVPRAISFCTVLIIEQWIRDSKVRVPVMAAQRINMRLACLPQGLCVGRLAMVMKTVSSGFLIEITHTIFLPISGRKRMCDHGQAREADSGKMRAAF